MASAERQLITESGGGDPAGTGPPGAEPLVGVREVKLPEAESFLSIFMRTLLFLSFL